MASLRMCNINSCKRTSRALCNCCQQYVCVDHLKEHEDIINAQLTPLADEINLLCDQFNNFSLLQSGFLTDLDKWHDEAHRVIDRYYQRKKGIFENLVHKERNTQKRELDRLRDQVNGLIREQEATQEHINSIHNDLRFLQQQINHFPFPSVTVPQLIIDEYLVSIDAKISKSKDLLPLSPPHRTVDLIDPYFSIAASENYLLVTQVNKLCLLDQELLIIREIPWAHGVFCNMFWSRTLARFILTTPANIFTLDEKTIVVEQTPITRNSDIDDWYCGTWANDSLFLSTGTWGPSIYEYNLLPSIQFVKEYRSPLTCTKNEVIDDLASNNIALALVIINRQGEVHFDLCSITTLERLWSIQLRSFSPDVRIRCCSLNNNQWMLFNRLNSELLHVSADGTLIKKENYNPSPRHGVQFGYDNLAILTEESVNLHELL